MSDLPIYLILTTLLTALGFGLTAAIIWALLHKHRSPTSTFAWLLAIVLLPYVGIPLFILFGGRKLDRIMKQKSLPIDFEDPDRDVVIEDGILLPSALAGVFPRVACGSPELVTDSVAAFDRLLQLIEGAQSSIDVCTYILGNDETGRAIIRALTERVEAGVVVRLLVDSYGSMTLSSKELTDFRDADGQLAYFMPIINVPFQPRLNLRNHRKTIVVDQHTAMMGGMNLSKDYMGKDANPDYWDDLCVIMEGEIAKHVAAVFNSDWCFALGQDTDDYSLPDGEVDAADDSLVQLVASGPDVKGDPIHDSILVGLFGAAKRVWIVSPYVLPDEMLLKAMSLAAQRGIDIRLITPEKSNHPLADFARVGYLDELSDAGVRIYFHQGAMLHGKAMLIDDDLAFLGSANLDMRSMFFNFEIAGVIRDNAFTEELGAWVERLMQESREGIPKKSRLAKAWYGLGRLIAPVL